MVAKPRVTVSTYGCRCAPVVSDFADFLEEVTIGGKFRLGSATLRALGRAGHRGTIVV